MAMIYVAHEYGGKAGNVEKAKKITHDLQIKDLENCYFCPLTAFSYLGYKEIGYAQEMALCLDVLSLCDILLVASPISNGVQEEIDFAKMVGMEVKYLEYD